jgi:hypothetical protein
MDNTGTDVLPDIHEPVHGPVDLPFCGITGIVIFLINHLNIIPGTTNYDHNEKNEKSNNQSFYEIVIHETISPYNLVWFRPWIIDRQFAQNL